MIAAACALTSCAAARDLAERLVELVSLGDRGADRHDRRELLARGAPWRIGELEA
jgi:hypothetical protein